MEVILRLTLMALAACICKVELVANSQYLVLGNLFEDPELLESIRHQWQQFPNWKAANVEGLLGKDRRKKMLENMLILLASAPNFIIAWCVLYLC